MNTMSAAIDAARRLTRHQISFIAPVVLPGDLGATGSIDRNQRIESLPERGGHIPSRRGNPRPRRGDGRVAPPLDDETAFEAEKLLDELNSLRRARKPTTAEKQRLDTLNRRILELTGFSAIGAVRAAVRSYVTRRDGARKFIPTKPYAQGPARTPPPITIVRGGAPGGGKR
jgi:hypothetical protein